MFDNFIYEFCKDSTNIDGGFSQTISRMKTTRHREVPIASNESKIESARSQESYRLN